MNACRILITFFAGMVFLPLGGYLFSRRYIFEGKQRYRLSIYADTVLNQVGFFFLPLGRYPRIRISI